MTNTTPPKLNARWTIKRDDNGFQAFVTGTSFASIDAVMQQAFGTPKLSDDGAGTSTGLPHRVWSAVDIGVAIQLVGRPNGTDVICVRGVNDMMEVFRHLQPSNEDGR